MRSEAKLSIAILALCTGGLAASQVFLPYRSVRDAPITKFEQADLDLMRGTLSKALDDEANGTAYVWTNPGTESSGTITVASDPKGRALCRLARIENRHKALKSEEGYIFCKSQAEGRKWDLMEPWPG